MLYTVAIVWIHFVADFLLQGDKMATRKSSSLKWLLLHCTVYTAPFLLFGIRFAAITFVAHLVTDYWTSKGTTLLWKADERHWFFCLIGLDQAIHITTLIVTYLYLFGNPYD